MANKKTDKKEEKIEVSVEELTQGERLKALEEENEKLKADLELISQKIAVIDESINK